MAGCPLKVFAERLNLLHVDDPFSIRNCNEIIDFLSSHEHTADKFYAFSVDVENLFYSIPQAELCIAVQKSIETQGHVAF